MALITCKICGKKISDTVKKCIHCGSEITLNEVIEIQENTIIQTSEESSPQNLEEEDEELLFSDLKNDERKILVKEFWESDKQAYSYIVGNQIAKKFHLGWYLRYLPPYLIFFVFLFVLKLRPQNIKILIFTIVTILSLTIIEIIISAILKRKYENKAKKYAYKKRFKIWLEENKNIIYYPIFLDKKEERIFEEINIKKVKL